MAPLQCIRHRLLCPFPFVFACFETLCKFFFCDSFVWWSWWGHTLSLAALLFCLRTCWKIQNSSPVMMLSKSLLSCFSFWRMSMLAFARWIFCFPSRALAPFWHTASTCQSVLQNGLDYSLDPSKFVCSIGRCKPTAGPFQCCIWWVKCIIHRPQVRLLCLHIFRLSLFCGRRSGGSARGCCQFVAASFYLRQHNYS